jgi:methyl-accepting chemotaxis protein
MLIRSKLLLSGALSIGALVAMFGLQQYSLSNQADLARIAQNVIELEKGVLDIRKDEKDFFDRLDLKYVSGHGEKSSELDALMSDMKQSFAVHGIATTTLDSFGRSVSVYNSIFSEVVSLQKEIGLTPKSGLYGTLRDSVHNVETILEQHNQPELEVVMLQLRRNEKDFMLRRETSYLEKFDSNIKAFNRVMAGAGLADDVTAKLTTLIGAYQKDFNALVSREQAFGLSANDGKMKQLREAITQTEENSQTMKQLAFEALDEAKANSLVLGVSLFILIGLVLAAITFRVIQSIILPVNRITGIISVIEENQDLSQRCDESGDDEVSQIARHFNRMLESFQQLIQQVIDSVTTMNHTCQELSHNAELASEGVARQLNETDMVATAITQMGATIEEIAKNTELAAAKASQTHENARRGQSGVEQTIEKIGSLAQQLNHSADVVSELERDSGTIGSVLEVIRGIAEQTNLLALNAAIEAARAGEQGRGFAVVADEVRSLAMRTQESTEEIAGIIQTLQARTRSIVQLMEASQKQGSDSASQAAAAGDLLRLINADVTNIMDMSTQIAAAIEQQSQVASEVNKNVVVIRDIAEHSSNTANENASASSDVKSMAEFLQKAVSRFKI